MSRVCPDDADVIIAGSGLAGLFCALQLPPSLKVLILTKQGKYDSNSALAQGGMSILRSPEDKEVFFLDTFRAGHGQNDPQAVQTMIDASPAILQDLQALGMVFDQEGKSLAYAREGGHSQSRILHCRDHTGEALIRVLLQEIESRENIEIWDYCPVLDLILCKGRVTGVWAVNKQKQLQPIGSQAVVLATGGIGGLFEHSTNWPHITGDALAIAIKHQIRLDHLHYLQVHPTALFENKPGRRFLISEALRGEGARLLNHQGRSFAKELWPRDRLTQAIQEEMKREQKDWVWLDARHLGKIRLKTRFPTIYQHCLSIGIQAESDLIPVCPAHHYHMGGLAVDLAGRTSLTGLYSVGESACNRVHGANRLASNSLLESLVFAKAAARAIPLELPDQSFKSLDPGRPPCFPEISTTNQILDAIERSRACDPSTTRKLPPGSLDPPSPSGGHALWGSDH